MSNNGQEVDWQPRRARLDEAPVAADLWLLSCRASIPRIHPPTHSDAEVRAWFKEVVFPSKDVWVIEASDHLAALMVIDDVWIEQPYVEALLRTARLRRSHFNRRRQRRRARRRIALEQP